MRDPLRIVLTADYFVIPAPVPCSVALFTCPCGATTVESDPKQVAPKGWTTSEDGSVHCPTCSAKS